MSEEHVDRAAAYWNCTHAAPDVDAHDNIFNHPLVQAYASLRAFGNLTGQLQAVVVALRERTRPGDEILSMGCGRAVKERVLAEALPDRRFLAFDIAAGIVAEVRSELAAARIHNLKLEVQDFNRLRLDAGRFACVLGGVGWSLLGPVLMHQIGAFDPANWEHNLVLARLFAAEDQLLRQGVLQDDFAMFVAVKR